jgi:hypothetical protein
MRPVAEQEEGPLLDHRPDRLREGHVGALARPVRVEEPEHDDVEAEAALVGARQVLAGQLRDPVR